MDGLAILGPMRSEYVVALIAVFGGFAVLALMTIRANANKWPFDNTVEAEDEWEE